MRPFAAHWVIDETTAVSLAQRGRRAARIGFTVTGLTLYLLWNLTTLLGALGAEALGDTDAWGLDAAGPAVFLALLAPMLKTAVERAVAGLAVLLGLGLLPVLPAGVPVLAAALAAPAVLYVEGRRAAGAEGGRPGTTSDRRRNVEHLDRDRRDRTRLLCRQARRTARTGGASGKAARQAASRHCSPSPCSPPSRHSRPSPTGAPSSWTRGPRGSPRPSSPCAAGSLPARGRGRRRGHSGGPGHGRVTRQEKQKEKEEGDSTTARIVRAVSAVRR